MNPAEVGVGFGGGSAGRTRRAMLARLAGERRVPWRGHRRGVGQHQHCRLLNGGFDQRHDAPAFTLHPLARASKHCRADVDPDETTRRANRPLLHLCEVPSRPAAHIEDRAARGRTELLNRRLAARLPEPSPEVITESSLLIVLNRQRRVGARARRAVQASSSGTRGWIQPMDSRAANLDRTDPVPSSTGRPDS